MFSKSQKQKIAAEIEALLLSFNHPEMPSSRPNFLLHVNGAEGWSWADIEPNWKYETIQPEINPHNERMDLVSQLVKEVDSLNPECLTLGAGKMATLKELANKILR